MKCDLCSSAISFGGKRFSASEIQAAVSSGLRLPQREVMLGVALGRSAQQVQDDWVAFVMRDTADWMLCPSCASKVR